MLVLLTVGMKLQSNGSDTITLLSAPRVTSEKNGK